MIKNKITVAIFSVFLIGAILHTEEAYSKASITEVKASEGVLTQLGSPSGVLEPLKGFAKDLPLVAVMRQITPNGWIVKKSEGEDNTLDTDMLVSWQGGSSWVETLGTIVRTYPVNANVNWMKKEITLMAVENRVVAKKMIFELERGSAGNKITTGASEQVKAVEVAPVLASWILDSKMSLRENVTEWANSSGYRVVWLGEDYAVDDSRVLTGSFDQENGPIKQLSEDYGPKSRVRNPLSFQFFQNSTLVVETWKFEQSGYPQQGYAE